MDESTATRVARHVRRNLLGDYPIESPNAQSSTLTPRALAPGGMGSTTQEVREEMVAQMGYATISPTLREALDELIVAGRVGAGDHYLVMMRREVVRHERQKDAAIIGLLELLRMLGYGDHLVTAEHGDGCNCPISFIERYALAVLNPESRTARLTFETALERLRQSSLTLEQERAEQDASPKMGASETQE